LAASDWEGAVRCQWQGFFFLFYFFYLLVFLMLHWQGTGTFDSPLTIISKTSSLSQPKDRPGPSVLVPDTPPRRLHSLREVRFLLLFYLFYY
jgi:hypothetical protein